MRQVDTPRLESPPKWATYPNWQILLIVLSAVLLCLVLAIFKSSLRALDIFSAFLFFGAAVFSVLIVLYTRSLRRAQQVQLDTEERLQQMADNIQEIFWMIDAETKKALYVTEAYETITGRSCQSLMDNPSSYEELIHPEDRLHVLAKLGEATQTGHFDERFRIVRPRGGVRWVTVHGFPVRDTAGKIHRLVGTARDITAQKGAEDKVAEHLAEAESARAESDALNKATLALTADLRMDFVLDRLLQSLMDLIPCECARVLLLEGDSQLLVAREKLRHESPKKASDYPLTLDAADSPFLLRIITAQHSVLLSDTKQEKDWPSFKGHTDIRSWLCVPLVASQQTLGLLSVGHTQPNTFTQDHLRRTHLLAIPAAAAIQNSRLYERAEIFGSELQRRLTDLRQTEKALEQSEEGRRVSEDKFQKVFRSSPVAFSISTLGEGRYIEVNSAFEQRYGYSRTELIGRTAEELRVWEDPTERTRLVDQLRRGRPVRNFVTRFRTKPGDLIVTVFSADTIQFDGQLCLLAVSEDVPNDNRNLTN
ncbi:MAG: PAS domain S-box protein [Acidobacteriia bacterium]|nr:PAS domain S-box protein [Terriglobia bacterium]